MSLFHRLKDSPQVWAPYEAEGTVFGSINRRQLESLRLHVVRTDRQITLERELEALESRIASTLDENDQLAAIRDMLLPQLMSGKIRVKDAEKTVEEVL
jgi:type I restriction enzyme S subunit